MALAPLVGLCFYAFISSVRTSPVVGDLATEPVAGLVASLVLLAVGRRQADRRLMPFVCWVAIPLCAVITIVMGSFPLYTAPRLAGVLFSFVFGAMMTVVGLVVVCVVTQAREFPRALVACAATAALALFSLVGLAVANAAELSGLVGPVTNTVCVVYYGVLVLWPCFDLWRLSATAPAQESASPRADEGRNASEALRERCDELSKRYGLTRREGEIFSYLGRGYSPAFVARVLFVSESTVRSHVKAIYQKLGVTSREELITLVDSD